LVYLDPPFNSNKDYNVLFEEHDGTRSAAQIKVFEDTWRWDSEAAARYDEVLRDGGKVAEALQAFRLFLGRSDMMAYLANMAPRLVELRRVLKPHGSIYLHCDATASHYLKVLMDAVFGVRNCRREIIWRSGWVSGFKTRAKNWVRNHDTLLYYVKDSANFTFNKELAYKPHAEGYERRGGGENPLGVAIDDVWDEVELYSPWIKSFSKEKLGYMTQKPRALLERIIKVSSRPGDLVLDPFCGCGTSIEAAEALGRRWIGIDITQLAVSLIKHRLQALPGVHAKPTVVGEPTVLEDAAALAQSDPYQFQWWALGLVGARPADQRKGADKGIDGRLFFSDDPAADKPKRIILSVKAGHVTASQVRDLRGVLEREGATIGVFISLQEPTRPMKSEALEAGFYESPWGKHPRMQLLTIEELLGGKGIDYPRTAGTNRTYAEVPKIKKVAEPQPQLFDLPDSPADRAPRRRRRD
jgi:DNA modification methylase